MHSLYDAQWLSLFTSTSTAYVMQCQHISGDVAEVTTMICVVSTVNNLAQK